jgi:NADP-dependent 3-hydroxy acid dehydrogenase YdfG
MKKTVFITGATSGFGEACARQFAAQGYRVIINGRRKERLQKLKQEIETASGAEVYILPFDVRDRAIVEASIKSLPPQWQSIDVLVNNAGLALGRDLFEEASLEDWDTMLDTNVKGLLYVSRAVVPMMIRAKKGHVINIGSIAGKEVYERGNVYCASKHAVDALNKAMRIELLRHGIKVTAIHPGAAETEFSLVRFKGDSETAKKVYEGYKALSPGDVASIVLYTASLPPHVCINDLVVTPTQQASAYHFHKNT